MSAVGRSYVDSIDRINDENEKNMNKQRIITTTIQRSSTKKTEEEIKRKGQIKRPKVRQQPLPTHKIETISSDLLQVDSRH